MFVRVRFCHCILEVLDAVKMQKNPCCHPLKQLYVQGHNEEVVLVLALGSDIFS